MSNATQTETGSVVPSARERSTSAAVVRLAESHLDEGTMRTSAALAYYDAIALLQMGNEVAAERRALDSLSYSVGVFHADFTRAAEMARVWG